MPAARALSMLVLAACGRLGFDPSEVDAGDVSNDSASDATPVDGASEGAVDGPDSMIRACATNSAYVALAGSGTTSRYKNVAGLTPWSDAVMNCEADDAHLAIPDSMNEALAIGDNGDWVGITDATSEGTWLTLFGAPAPFLMFQAGQPDGGTGEDCLRVDGSGTFEDRDCTDARDFVCECPP